MRREELNIGDFEAIDTEISEIDTEIMDKDTRIELYEKYLPPRPTSGNTLSRVCSQIIQNKLIGTEKFHKWLKQQNKTNSQLVIRELFRIFAWRLIKNHKTRDIYHFIRISNKLIQQAEKLQFTELSKYIKSWQQKILKENLKKIIQIRREFIQKSKDQKKSVPTFTEVSTNIPTDTTDKPDKNEIIDQIVNLLLQLKE